MKKIYLMAWVAMLTFLGACNREEVVNPNLEGNDFTLTTQSEVNAFNGNDDIRTLTITGTEITDLSKLPVQRLKNLIIENTGVVSLNFPKLEAASVSILLKGNTKLQNLNGLNNLKFFGGNFLIENNDALTDISGILGIKTFFGTLTVIGNNLLGENTYPMPSEKFGFYPIKTMINNGIIPGATAVTLADNHPKAVTDPSLIGIPQGNPVLDYIIRSKNDAINFKCWNSEGIINNITISGADVDVEALVSLVPKITKVMGTFSLTNAPVGNPGDDFFVKIRVLGGVVLKNLPNINNINSFKGLAGELTGDLIIEDMPNIDFGWDEAWPGGAGFQKITKIGGSLIVKGSCKFKPISLKNLTSVGKDFIFSNLWQATDFNNFNDMLTNFRYIGGNLIVEDCIKPGALGGLQNITYIGGSIIKITNNRRILLGYRANNPALPGLCLVRDWFNKGVIKNPNCAISLTIDTDPNWTGPIPVDFATLAGCN
jgi:hypothetical protein